MAVAAFVLPATASFLREGGERAVLGAPKELGGLLLGLALSFLGIAFQVGALLYPVALASVVGVVGGIGVVNLWALALVFTGPGRRPFLSTMALLLGIGELTLLSLVRLTLAPIS